MSKKYYSKQLGLFLLYVGAILAVYLFFAFQKESKDFLEKIAKGENKAIFITADGLITTSTFAFVAFSSLSPSSSGSSATIKRLDWKGLWFSRYSTLLITSVSLTLISCLLILENLAFMVISVSISSLIIVWIIIKYVSYHKSSEIKAAKKFENIIKHLNYNPTAKQLAKKSDKSYIHKLKNILRPIISPLKGTHNVDLLRLILTSEFVKKMQSKHFQKYLNSKDITKILSNSEPTPNVPNKNQIEIFVYARLLIPTKNGILSPSEEAYLAAALSISFGKYQKEQNEKFECFNAPPSTGNLKFILNEIYGIKFSIINLNPINHDDISPSQIKSEEAQLDRSNARYIALEKDAEKIRAIMIQSDREITDMEL